MRKKHKKITLHRETLLHLEPGPLREVAGGATVRYCDTDGSCLGTCQQASCAQTCAQTVCG